jgi:FkbM family methyltransferase
VGQNTVSVIIPYYRAAQTIGRAVRSALAQTHAPCEILVVDDGSNDNLAGAIEEFGFTVTLIRKSNGGAASARNAGIEHARGEWIAFLDADDYWEPPKLERQLAFSEDVELVGARWFEEHPGKPRYVARVPDAKFFGRTFNARGSEAFHAAMNLWTGVLLVRRSALGDERFVSGLEPAEDRDLWIRIAAGARIHLVPEPLATYVQYDDSLSNSMLKVVRRHATLLGAKETRKQEAMVYRRWAGCHLARGTARFAVTPAARRLAIQPASIQAWWIMCKSLARSVKPAPRASLQQRRILRRLEDSLSLLKKRTKVVGFRAALRMRQLEKQHLKSPLADWPEIPVQPKTARHRLSMRTGPSSDYEVAEQVFGQQQYAPLKACQSVNTIADCGSNVGYASAYLLTRFPTARLIAVEPEPSNYEMCCRNLAPYGTRATAINAAVWSCHTKLSITRDFRDGREWTARTADSGDNRSVNTVTMEDLIRLAGGALDLIKVDIEGAETELFRHGAPWLSMVRHIAIELHGSQAEHAFRRCIAPHPYDLMESGDMLICLRHDT